MSGIRSIRAIRRTLIEQYHSQTRYASTSMRMPAMSPTMTEGGIAGWKKKEGESFAAGDVLLEVETDKATIDVEAQDDGILGKIISDSGSSKIPVGQIIAILAEEGDDLSSIEIPKDLSPPGSSSLSPSSSSEPPKEEKKAQAPRKEEESSKSQESKGSSSASSSSSSSGETSHGHKEIKHSKPLFPSVSRLLQESSLTQDQISKLKGTGKRGMLTKGDVLLAMGQIKNAYGSAEKITTDVLGPSGKRASESKATAPTGTAEKKEEPLDAAAIKRLILAGMTKATRPAEPLVEHFSSPLAASHDDFDEIIAPYTSLLPPPQPSISLPNRDALAAMESKGTPKQDEYAGLW